MRKLRYRSPNPFFQVFKGKTVVVGTGNVLRGDDGLGPRLAERLRAKVSVPCINAGNALENYLGKILRERPDTVLFIDAAQLGLQPGEFELFGPEQVLEAGLSTHDVSPRMYLDLLASELKGEIYLLGVQPKQLELGAGLSRTIQRTLRVLERQIVAAV